MWKKFFFSGAHADVGGGYANTIINGVSMNWMLSNLKDTGLLYNDVQVPQNMFDNTNDPESGIVWGTLYHKKYRSLNNYVYSEVSKNEDINQSQSMIKKLKVHNSVFEKLKKEGIREHKFNWFEYFPECTSGTKQSVILDKECFEVIYNK